MKLHFLEVPVALCFLMPYGEGHTGALPAAGGDSSRLLAEPRRELDATFQIPALLLLMTSNPACSLSLAQLQG